MHCWKHTETDDEPTANDDHTNDEVFVLIPEDWHDVEMEQLNPFNEDPTRDDDGDNVDIERDLGFLYLADAAGLSGQLNQESVFGRLPTIPRCNRAGRGIFVEGYLVGVEGCTRQSKNRSRTP